MFNGDVFFYVIAVNFSMNSVQ